VSTHWIDRLSEFSDGELSPSDYTACKAHVDECALCQKVLSELQLVTVVARADADREPASDLWPTINARLNDVARDQGIAAEPDVRRFAPRPSTRRQFTFSLPQLALAASLLIAVSAAVSYWAAGRDLPRPAAEETPIQAVAESLASPSGEIVRANFADEQFERAIADLERILVEQRDELDPRTVVVIERNLSAIDEAIRQARAALDADPANTFLNSHLADARRRKLDLLRHATSIVGS
jgi:hypothetical protein